MRQLAKRVHSLEVGTGAPSHPEVWHRLMWDVGQSWDDALATYGEDRIQPGDGVVIIAFVGADDGKPLYDPVRERDQPKADAWMAARETERCAS